MKNLGNLISAMGILLFVYSIVGKFIGGPTIGLGFLVTSSLSGMVFGVGLMLIGMIAKDWEK